MSSFVYIVWFLLLFINPAQNKKLETVLLCLLEKKISLYFKVNILRGFMSLGVGFVIKCKVCWTPFDQCVILGQQTPWKKKQVTYASTQG